MSKRTKYLLGIGVIAALVIGWQVAAFAVHDEGKFELEGDATSLTMTPPPPSDVPTDDWDRVCHQVTVTKDTTNQIPNECTGAGDTTGASAVAWVAEPKETDGSATIFTGGGSKDPNDISKWAWKGKGGLPDKDNLQHAFAARYTASGQDLLYFGSDRYDNSGDAVQGFWFFQNQVAVNNNGTFSGTHRDGDLLILSDFSKGGDVSTIAVYKWLNGGLTQLASSDSANCANPQDDRFCGIVSPLFDDPATTTADDGTTPSPWTFLDKTGKTGFLGGELFEGGIDLSALGLAGECFATVAAESRSSTSTTATLKDFVLGKFGECGSTTTTTPKQADGTTNIPSDGISIGTNGSVQVKDSALVAVPNAGTTTWSGSVSFSLCKVDDPGLCTTGGTTINAGTTPPNAAVPVDNDPNTAATPTAVSNAATVTSAGRYCWRAEFTPTTSTVTGSSDSTATECFTVNPVTPTLTTNASAGVNLGAKVSDDATLTGTANQPGTGGTPTPSINPTTPGAKAGGTITFKLYGPDDATCSNAPVFTSQPVTVTGDGTYNSGEFQPTQPGTYRWVATYSGNLPNTNTKAGACNDANESVTVTSVKSTIRSEQTFVLTDKAFVSAPEGGNLAGTVKFELFPTSDCTGTAIYTETKNVSGSSPQNVSTTPQTFTSPGSNLSWQLTYTSTNQAQKSIPASCQETSAVTISNGQPVESP